jgi:trimeric autotransporter adhesin
VEGDLYVMGEMVTPASTSRVDHPLDPDNHYLQHASVESSELKTVYDGVVTTDANGEATVELPPWLESLNGDFRYQLTTIDSFARAMVSRKMADNEFSIRTDEPNVEVSWQVTGIRRDPWAEAHPLRVEIEKPQADRGRLLHPDVRGVEESRGVIERRLARYRRNR